MRFKVYCQRSALDRDRILENFQSPGRSFEPSQSQGLFRIFKSRNFVSWTRFPSEISDINFFDLLLNIQIWTRPYLLILSLRRLASVELKGFYHLFSLSLRFARDSKYTKSLQASCFASSRTFIETSSPLLEWIAFKWPFKPLFSVVSISLPHHLQLLYSLLASVEVKRLQSSLWPLASLKIVGIPELYYKSLRFLFHP